MPSEISLDHLLDLVKGQARMEEKIDRFLSAQEAHDAKLDLIDGRVDQVERSVEELKAQRRQDVAVVTVLWFAATTVGGAGIWLADKVNWTGIKALFVRL